MIKNATIYNVVMPNRDDFDDLIIDELVAKYPHETQRRTIGFSEIYPDVMTREIPKLGYAFNVTIWEKTIKSSVVNRLLRERTAKRGDVTREDFAEIKDSVVAELIAKTEAESKVVQCYYSQFDNFLFIDSSSTKVTYSIARLLISTVKSLKTTTIHLDSENGLTKAVEEAYGDQSYVIGDFDVADILEIVNPEKESLRFKNCELGTSDIDFNDSEHILKNLENGSFRVKSIGLSNDKISFTLTDEFKLKSIKYPSYEPPEFVEDDLELWQGEAYHDVSWLSYVTKTMVDKWSLPEQGDTNGDT